MPRRARPPSSDPGQRRAEEARDRVIERLLIGENRHPAVGAVGLGQILPEPVVVIGIYEDHSDETDDVLAKPMTSR